MKNKGKQQNSKNISLKNQSEKEKIRESKKIFKKEVTTVNKRLHLGQDSK
ncbi:hypothetical protein [Neobacillus niacini]|nr:hypothetical protein [Neobacillus niacini]MCM3692180.1 hypothetical protein [Neobacillus niacini]